MIPLGRLRSPAAGPVPLVNAPASDAPVSDVPVSDVPVSAVVVSDVAVSAVPVSAVVVSAVLTALLPALAWALALASTASAVPPTIDTAAATRAPATRGISWTTAGDCDLATVAALSAGHPDVRQFVVSSTADFGASFGATFVAARRVDGTWVCQTDTAPARLGRNGTRPLRDRRSGDGTTPAGVFPLGEVTAWDGEPVNVFGNRPDPGVHPDVHYRDVRPEDCWGATPNTADYNHLVARTGCPGPDDEWLPKFGDVYSHAAVIGANLDPISGDAPGEPAYAAAIFLHRHSYRPDATTRPTSGCVSLASIDLVEVLRLLDPALDPHFAIGPVDFLRSAARG